MVLDFESREPRKERRPKEDTPKKNDCLERMGTLPPSESAHHGTSSLLPPRPEKAAQGNGIHRQLTALEIVSPPVC